MADRRRRRRTSTHSDSDCSEEDPAPNQKAEKRPPKDSECESEVGDKNDSEYESANEDDYTYDDETATEYDEGSVIVEGYDEDEGWIDGERQSGDGEEQPDGEGGNLDDDEDRKNPAYIPRKGAFYEHDLRLGEEDGIEPEEKDNVERPLNKKLWKEENKWDHDRFSMDQQAPKSREELVTLYGYDIRAYDKPPDMPKRGSRGRGGPRSQRKNNFGEYFEGDRYSGGNDRYSGGNDRYSGGNDRYSGGNDRYSGGNDRYSGGNDQRQFTRGRGSRGSSGVRGDRGSSRGRGRGRGGRLENVPKEAYVNIHSGGEGRSQTLVKEDFPPLSHQGNRSYSNQHRSGGNNSNNVGQRKSVTPEKSPTPTPERQAYRKQNYDQTREFNSNVPSRGSRSGRGSSNMGSNGNYNDRKSYSRERRNKPGRNNSSEIQQYPSSLDQKMENLGIRDDEMEAGGDASSASVRQQGATDATNVIVNKEGTKQGQSTGKGNFPPPPQNAPSRQEMNQGRTKRYSSQRQRNMPEGNFQEATTQQNFYSPMYSQQSHGQIAGPRPVVTKGPPVSTHATGPRQVRPMRGPPPPGSPQNVLPHQQNQSQVVQSPPNSVANFPQPPIIGHPQQVPQYNIIGTVPSQIPSQHMYTPVATMATAQPMIQTAYIAAPVVNYGTPQAPPPSHFQMAGHVPLPQNVQPIPQNVHPMPQNVQPMPQNLQPIPQRVPAPQTQIAAVPPPPPSTVAQGQLIAHQDGTVIRGGVTYFNPDVQKPSLNPHKSGVTYFSPEIQTSQSHSPLKRTKAAIPIINPEDLAKDKERQMHAIMENPEIHESYVEVEDIGELETIENHDPEVTEYVPEAESLETGSSATAQCPVLLVSGEPLNEQSLQESGQPDIGESNTVVESDLNNPIVNNTEIDNNQHTSNKNETDAQVELIKSDPEESLKSVEQPAADQSTTSESEKLNGEKTLTSDCQVNEKNIAIDITTATETPSVSEEIKPEIKTEIAVD